MNNIPIILINHNRLTTTKKLYEQLLQLGYESIWILDMGSEYDKLLSWYTMDPKLNVIYYKNTGHKALWNDGLLQQYFSQYPWVAISDSDIELNENTPKNFIEDMITVAKDFRVDKVGLALDYWNIKNEFLGHIIKPIESQYWHKSLKHRKYEVYDAKVDTSFCIVQPSLPFTYTAVRIGGNFVATHVPWDTDFDNLDEEEKFFIEHCDPKVSTYAGHYFNYLKTKQ